MELDAESILAADDLKSEQVDVPEWGGHVFVRVMKGHERDSFEASIMKGQGIDYQKIRAKMAVLVLCDSKGKRLFGQKHINDLAEKSAAALDRVFEVAQRINRITDKDVQELQGNSEGGQSAGSGSA